MQNGERELASACGLSISTFKRQLGTKSEKGPAEWMQKQLFRGRFSISKLSVTDLPLGIHCQ